MESDKAPQFDTDDFSQRWLKARLSAFRGNNPNQRPFEDLDLEATLKLEALWLDSFFIPSGAEKEHACAEKKDTLLRNLFDNSRKLALSLSKRLGLTFEVQDFQTLLKSSGIPCVQGEWSSRPNARVLKREGCDFCHQAGSHTCDYWREALDGLVMGLGDKERLARHASIRHGDEYCIDVFYSESVLIGEPNLAWSPLPEHMALDLYEIAAHFQNHTDISIDLKGFREGVLFFEFASTTDKLCGNSNLLATKLKGMIREKFPGLAIKDVTPQAVLGTTAG